LLSNQDSVNINKHLQTYLKCKYILIFRCSPLQINQLNKLPYTNSSLQDSSSEDKDLFSYTIITVDSTDTFKWLHHRMPVRWWWWNSILQTSEHWINNTFAIKRSSFRRLLKTPGSIRCWPLSPWVHCGD